jgi:HK97 gp10 family phage protein
MADDGGLSRIQQRLSAIPKLLKDRMKVVTLEEAGKLAADMRALALSSKDTGKLIESVTVTPAGERTPPYSQPGGTTVVPENAAMVTAGNRDVRYPHLVEYGTAKAHAQPFFWPAVQLNKRRMLARMRREIGKTIRENWGGARK